MKEVNYILGRNHFETVGNVSSIIECGAYCSSSLISCDAFYFNKTQKTCLLFDQLQFLTYENTALSQEIYINENSKELAWTLYQQSKSVYNFPHVTENIKPF